MAEVVRPELQFEALLRLAIRRRHDARVADEDIEPGEGPCIGGSAHAHGVEIGKVKQQRVEFGLRNFRSDTRDSRGCLIKIAARQNRVGPISSETTCGFKADARVGARHQRDPSSQIRDTV